jgi:hypothetical protein
MTAMSIATYRVPTTQSADFILYGMMMKSVAKQVTANVVSPLFL